MNKKNKKQSKNKSNALKNALKQQDHNVLLINNLIGDHNRLEKGYKTFLKDFKILLCFNVLQIIMFIVLFFSMQFYNILMPAYLLIMVAMMFAYIRVIKKIK